MFFSQNHRGTTTSGQCYVFGPFRLDTRDRLLLRDGKPISLPPKVTETLLLLLDQAGHVVEKEEILTRVWPDTFVEEASLAQNISLLRKALGQSHEDHTYIETIPRRGYRFVAPVELTAAPAAVDRTGRVRAISALAALLAGALTVLILYWQQQPSSEPPLRTPKTMAVLPFEPIGTTAADEHLGLGLADTLITKLANIREVTVRPTSSVRRYAGSDQPRSQVGGLLGRPALAVDRRGRHRHREPGRQPRRAGDVERLLARHRHAPAHDLVDLGGVDARSLDAGSLDGAQ